MPLFNCDFFFEDSGTTGWTERWFWSGASISAASTAFAAVTNARLGILPLDCQLIARRVSTPGLPPNSLLGTFPPGFAPGTYGDAGSKSLPADCCALWTVNGSDVIKNRKFARTILPVDLTQDQFTPTLAYTTALSAFVVALAAQGFVAATAYHVGVAQMTTPITQISIAPFVHYRKAGRPFGQLRGRRRKAIAH